MNNLVDEVTVRIEDLKENYVASYSTSNLSDTYSFYKLLQKESQSIIIRPDNGEGEEKEAWIRDINVRFGNGENMFSITLYCEVI